MKKAFIILSLVGLLVLSLGMSAMANGIYLDGMMGCNWKLEGVKDLNAPELPNNEYDGDLNGLILGYDYSIDQFMLGLELSSGQIKTTNFGNIDFDTIHFKGGYKFLEDDKYSIAATLGYYNQSLGNNPTLKINGIMFGADAVYNFNKKSCIQSSLEFSVTGQTKVESLGRDTTTLLFNTKYSYLFTDDFGVSIGYRYSQNKIDDLELKWTQSGPTIGVTCKLD